MAWVQTIIMINTDWYIIDLPHSSDTGLGHIQEGHLGGTNECNNETVQREGRRGKQEGNNRGWARTCYTVCNNKRTNEVSRQVMRRFLYCIITAIPIYKLTVCQTKRVLRNQTLNGQRQAGPACSSDPAWRCCRWQADLTAASYGRFFASYGVHRPAAINVLGARGEKGIVELVRFSQKNTVRVTMYRCTTWLACEKHIQRYDTAARFGERAVGTFNVRTLLAYKEANPKGHNATTALQLAVFRE